MKRALRLTAARALLLSALPLPAAAQALTLAAAADSALAAHPSLGSAHARHEAASHARDIARAARLPSASLGATVTRFEEPMVVAPLHSFDPRHPPSFDDALVQGQIVVDYTLFDSGVRSSRTDGADARAEAAVFGLAAAEMDVIAEVARHYLAVLSARAVQAPPWLSCTPWRRNTPVHRSGLMRVRPPNSRCYAPWQAFRTLGLRKRPL